MPTLAAMVPAGFADLDTKGYLRVFPGLGVQTLQLYRNAEATDWHVADVRGAADAAGLRFDSLHGQFGPTLDPSAPDATLRRMTLETYRREAELCLALGGRYVVVHPSPQDEGCGPERAGQRVAALRQSALELATLGQRLGVVFVLENLPPRYPAADPMTVAAVVRDVGSPHVRMCFDFGHAHMTQGAAGLAAALAGCADVIGYGHVHDNDTTADSHHVPGTATIPWATLTPALATLPAATPLMLELFQPPALLAELTPTLAPQLRAWLALQ